MGRRKIAAAMAAFLAFAPLTVNAQEPTASEVFAELQQESNSGNSGLLTFAVTGAAAAYSMANAELVANRKALPLYCQPPDQALNGVKYADITLREYRKHAARYDSLKGPAADALALALLKGLEATFPCK